MEIKKERILSEELEWIKSQRVGRFSEEDLKKVKKSASQINGQAIVEVQEANVVDLYNILNKHLKVVSEPEGCDCQQKCREIICCEKCKSEEKGA